MYNNNNNMYMYMYMYNMHMHMYMITIHGQCGCAGCGGDEHKCAFTCRMATPLALQPSGRELVQKATLAKSHKRAER